MSTADNPPFWSAYFKSRAVWAAATLGAFIVLASMIWAVGHRSAGRYQIGGNPGHICVIDTVTGEVWEKYATEHSGETDSNWKKPK
jgi:hypothetical protein